MPDSCSCHEGAARAGVQPQQPRKVQVTAKVLFGSVSAIASMKQAEKAQSKRTHQ
ncbi:unnamed protein product [Nesidiocoris tenuis]|uniref:Uncharacterized protein n=1 Tax=Nesidiocoris tenuis TaxID=355587 RepID=A0A6H5H8Y1_9HEMI|nr:unnamed protein product [Nesidiocoris tenuis]